MKNLRQLQSTIQRFESQISDLYDAINLNIQMLKLSPFYNKNKNQPTSHLQEGNIQKIQFKIVETQQLITRRKVLFSQYFIQNQISNECQQLRCLRLEQYQHIIFQLRRSASDKQSSYENLLRPMQKSLKRGVVQPNQNNQAQKYRLLLEQIDLVRTFLQKFRKNDKIGSQHNYYPATKCIFQSEQKSSSIRQSNKRTLNTSIVSTNSVNQDQNLQSSTYRDDNSSSARNRGNIYSQRSLRTIQFKKNLQHNNIQKVYNNRKNNANTHPLPFNLEERYITKSMIQQINQQQHQLKRIQQLQNKIIKKKEDNQLRMKELKQLLKQKLQLSKMKKVLKGRYMAYEEGEQVQNN